MKEEEGVGSVADEQASSDQGRSGRGKFCRRRLVRGSYREEMRGMELRFMICDRVCSIGNMKFNKTVRREW